MKTELPRLVHFYLIACEKQKNKQMYGQKQDCLIKYDLNDTLLENEQNKTLWPDKWLQQYMELNEQDASVRN
jgi:hypothetical protein